MKKQVLMVHGPNLGMLGVREPEIYGTTTLEALQTHVGEQIEAHQYQCLCFQSNHEGSIIDWLEGHRLANFLLINAGSLTHTSIALRDCLAGLQMPFLEIHISNVFAREPFRHHSYLSELAQGCIVGLGVKGYDLAVQYIIDTLKA